jgi:uncharacterized membrane-anchored protein
MRRLQLVRIHVLVISTDAVVGVSQTSLANESTLSLLEGFVTITTPKTFELQHRASNGQATSGFGVATAYGEVEVYAQVKITKVK